MPESNTTVSELPLVYMSTESALKQRAIAAVMERLGIPVRVDGKKLDSGVEEQPLSMDETYLGAKNRHEALRDLGVWAQEARGAKEKDPYEALTGGRITRQDTIEVAAFNAALQLTQEDA